MSECNKKPTLSLPTCIIPNHSQGTILRAYTGIVSGYTRRTSNNLWFLGSKICLSTWSHGSNHWLKEICKAKEQIGFSASLKWKTVSGIDRLQLVWLRQREHKTNISVQAYIREKNNKPFPVSTSVQGYYVTVKLPHSAKNIVSREQHGICILEWTRIAHWSALIPKMRTLCMCGNLATTNTNTATVLKKSIGCW